MKLLIAILFILSINLCLQSESVSHQLMDLISTKSHKDQFKLWHYLMEKPYDLNSEIAINKYRIFKKNLKKIEESNKKGLPYRLGFGPFTDMTGEEFMSLFKRKPRIEKKSSNVISSIKEINPEIIGRDWSDLYRSTKNQNTCGSCWAFAVICHNGERTHFSELGASILITDDYINNHFDIISKVRLIFTELYIFIYKKSIAFKLAELCISNEKLYSFNLPSTAFIEKYSIEYLEYISYGDIIFANREEASYLTREVLNIGYKDDSELSIILSKLPKKNKNKPRIFIVTCGKDPANICVYNHITDKLEFKGIFYPLPISNDKIIDTNGAGDSFAGGFLAYLEKGYNYEKCMYAGMWAANQIIQSRGCDIPYDLKLNLQ